MANQVPTHHNHHHQQHHPHHHPHHHHHRNSNSQQQQRRAVDLRIPAIENTAYCLCLHVKPTTIFIAVFKLIRALLFASILLNAEFSINDPALGEIGLAPMGDDRHRSTVIAVTILTRIIMASVSAVAIYAVISGRAAFLMPLYAMLLVDFFFALPAFYNKDLDPSFADGLTDFNNGKPPYPHASNQYTRYSLMLFSTITMIVKIYFLCVIWKCYRYLRLIELVSPIRLSEIYPQVHPSLSHSQYPIVRVIGGGGGLGGGGVADPSDLAPPGHNMPPPPYDSIISSMKPPVYEEAVKSSSNQMNSINILSDPMESSQSPAISSEQTLNDNQGYRSEALPTANNLERTQQDASATAPSVLTTTTTTTTDEGATSTTPSSSSTAITIDTSNTANDSSSTAPTESRPVISERQ